MTTDNVLDYLVYLERDCACLDRHEFWSDTAAPDISAARQFAEEIRGRLGGFLGNFVEVEQRVNVVFVRMVAETCPTAA
ncbi:MAG: hypothetical protein PF961_07860 [Planctomycetota bacterium]|jgi:hypothetical protein|nr:hypothetical protein [Planctomycetota bacterium]